MQVPAFFSNGQDMDAGEPVFNVFDVITCQAGALAHVNLLDQVFSFFA